MSIKTTALNFLSAAAVAACLFSCSKDDNNAYEAANGPKDSITSFTAYFFNTADSTTEVGACDDPDGPGPIQASLGGVSLKKNANYIVTISVEDATNPTKKVQIDKQIKNNGKDYKICFTTPLGISMTSTDSDGSMPIGLENTLTTTSTTGSDKIKCTIKYQKGSKNGQCDPGSVYYECNIPVSVY